MTTSPIRNLHDDVEREASDHGFGEQFQQALALADRRGLGAMPHVRSLMITPGRDRTRVLVNLGFVADRDAHVYVGGRNLEWFYGIGDDQLAPRLLPSGSNHGVDPASLSFVLGQFDGLIAGRVENQASPPPATELILDVLRSAGRAMTSDEIAELAGLWPRETRKVLSRLLSPSCPQRHLGRVARSDGDTFIAA